MVKKKEAPMSKMAAVRKLLSESPGMGPTEMVAALKAQGVEMDAAMASNYKSTILKGDKKTNAPKNPHKPKHNVKEGHGISTLRSVVELLGKEETKRLVDRL